MVTSFVGDGDTPVFDFNPKRASKGHAAHAGALTLAYPSPPASSGGLVVCSTWRVRRALRDIEDPQLLVITRGTSSDCIGKGWCSWQAYWFRRLTPS